jgi:hypothetical protein
MKPLVCGVRSFLVGSPPIRRRRWRNSSRTKDLASLEKLITRRVNLISRREIFIPLLVIIFSLAGILHSWG